MMIGIYRSNEVDAGHLLWRFLNTMNAKEYAYADVLHVLVENLSVKGVHQILQGLLETDSQTKTTELAKLCHRQTLGNPFYLKSYLTMLVDKSLLKYNLVMTKWTRNENDILSRTQPSENVVDFLKTQMGKQPPTVQVTLTLASFLGCKFEKYHLWLVLKSEDSSECTEADLVDALIACETEGFIRALGDSTLVWVHDSIQEAAVSMISEVERKKTSWKIGEILATGLKEREFEGCIFTIANLLNSGESRGTGRLTNVDVADINLRAARKAAHFAAFESAAKYVEFGLRCLPDTKWTTHYSMTLELYSLGAEVEGCSGNTEAVETYCSIVLAQRDNKPIQDLLRVYFVLIDSTFNLNYFNDAAELCLTVLAKCGCKFPKTKAVVTAQTLLGLLRLKVTIGSRSKKEIDRSRIIDDDFRIQLLKILDKLATCCYFAKEKLHLFPLIIFRSLEWTWKYGLSDYTPSAFATASALLNGIDDYIGSAVYANYAVNLLERVRNPRIAMSRTLYVSYAHSLHWTRPASAVLKPLLHGYDSGMRSGDTESATSSMYNYILLAFIAGKSLETLERDCRVYSAQMKQLKREIAYLLTLCTFQMILNLAGRSNNTTVLTGDAINECEYHRDFAESRYHMGWIRIHQMIIASYFGDYERSATLALSLGDTMKKDSPGSPLFEIDSVHRALSYYAMAQSTGLRKYKREAKKGAAIIKNWVKQGNPNVKHFAILLDAEQAVLNGKKNEAKKLYQEAISKAARCGLVHDAALASERFGLYLQRDGSTVHEEDEARFRIQESINFYRVWGAHRKADVLESELSQCLVSC